MSSDYPLEDEQPVETFHLTAITEKPDFIRKLRDLFETVPESERGDVIAPYERPNFSEGLSDKGGLLVCLSDGRPVACLMTYPYRGPLSGDSAGGTGDWYELGSIYVAPDYRKFQLAEFLVAYTVLRHYLTTPEVWLRGIFAVSFPYQHPAQRSADPAIPGSRGGMAHIFSATHLGFQPTTPPDALLEAREAKGLKNDLRKLWWFAGDFVLEPVAEFLDRTRDAALPNAFLLGRRNKALLDCGPVGDLPEGPFARLIEDPMAMPDGPGK